MGKKRKWNFSTIKKQNHKLSTDTLDIAFKDLNAANILYNSQLYPQAVYFLQQSVEKGWKSFGFWYGIIDEKEARYQVGHFPSEVGNKSSLLLQKILDNCLMNLRQFKGELGQQSNTIDEDLEYLFDIENKMTWLNKELEKVKRDPSYCLTLSDTDLDELVSRCNSYEESLKALKNLMNNKDFSDDMYATVKWGAKKELQKIYRNIPNKKRIIRQNIENEFQKEDIEKIIMSSVQSIVTLEPLLYLAILTQPHESMTRYASSEGGFSPIRTYNSECQIVKRFDELREITNSCFAHLEELYLLDEKGPENGDTI